MPGLGSPLKYRETLVDGVKVGIIEIVGADRIEFRVRDYTGLKAALSRPFIGEHSLGVVMLEEDEGYFLAKVIDLEHGGSVFLSADRETAVLEPGETGARPGTLRKLKVFLGEYLSGGWDDRQG